VALNCASTTFTTPALEPRRVLISTFEYRIRVHHSSLDLPAADWARLLARQAAPTPFMALDYLQALEASASATADTGWLPRWLAIYRDGRLDAACPLYLKSHSYGEYVFDWAWADAYRRHGLRYYPKALLAVPFTPVPGSRLLAADDAGRDRLVQAVQQVTADGGLSSAHALFFDAADRRAFERAGWMIRDGVQFHWQQDPRRPLADFDALLQSLQRDKRKKIQQERRRVAEAGVTFSVHEGAAIDGASWDFFHRCYQQTYHEHRSTPYLTRDFFARMATRMAAHWVMFIAHRNDPGGNRAIACSLIAVDAARRAAWGRYWGALCHLPCLHFEACYYQPLQWCLANGYRRFEGGAQGEHKMARGLLPVATHSAHWVADRRFAAAIAEALADERAGLTRYVDELREHSPFKNDRIRPADSGAADAGTQPWA
jgi:predicted N-acyltransferase